MATPVLADLIDPSSCAIVTCEVQGSIVGTDSAVPTIAKAARYEAIPNIERLLAAARSSGVPVVHCVISRPANGLSRNRNSPMFQAHDDASVDMSPGSAGASVVPELGPEPEDIVLTRRTGLGPMGGTDLDAVLRNLDVRTLVTVGVSLNVAIPNLVMDAVNHGYWVVVPRDAVAGVPRGFADQVIDYMLSSLAVISTADEVLGCWSSS